MLETVRKHRQPLCLLALNLTSKIEGCEGDSLLLFVPLTDSRDTGSPTGIVMREDWEGLREATLRKRMDVT